MPGRAFATPKMPYSCCRQTRSTLLPFKKSAARRYDAATREETDCVNALNRAYISAGRSGMIVVVDLKTLSRLQEIKTTGDGPDAVAEPDAEQEGDDAKCGEAAGISGFDVGSLCDEEPCHVFLAGKRCHNQGRGAVGPAPIDSGRPPSS